MRRLVPGLVLAFVGALMSVAVTQLPAHACSCKASDIRQDVERADAVFAGTVISVQRPPDENAGVVVVLAKADRSWKGRVPAQVELTTPASPGSCGVEDLKAEKKYLFFAQSDDAKLTIDSCGGTAPLTTALGDSITKLRGAGEDPAAAEEPTEEPPPPPPSADREVIDDTEPVGFARIAAPGGALVIIGVLGLLVLRRFSAR
ncbi:hypothetical protein [Nocardioides speluncae]|uniref:hypothetical protein n=1 Tax=Nocardioides speluncae TaxID=2670337 RepID=UPI0012B177C1|nr:hypothetical protein [Nocardioides speluncae]